MLSHAQTGRSRVISCHLRDIGGYRSTVSYICYRGKESWDNITRGQAESMRRLTHVIPSMPIKDRTVISAYVEIERMPLTQLARQLISTMKLSSSTQVRPRSIRVRTLDGSKDVQGARRETKGRVVLIVLAAGCP